MRSHPWMGWLLLMALLTGCGSAAPPTPLTASQPLPPSSPPAPERSAPNESLLAPCPTDKTATLDTFREALAEGNQSYFNLCQLVGPPNAQMGSGLIILIYELEDGSEVVLGYAGLTNLTYARHQQENGTVEELIDSQ